MLQPAAIIGCYHTCPQPKHVGGPVAGGSPNVFHEGISACRQTDPMVCKPCMDAVAKGSPTVYINGLQAARLGDQSVHGGKIVEGIKSVFIG